MLKNYFLTSLRFMLRQKIYSFINIFGLAVGIAATLVILLYVTDEFSYDRFHRDAERMYRVGFNGMIQGNEASTATSCSPVGEALQKEVPEVKEAVRFGLWRTTPVRYGDKNFTEKNLLVADSNFFRFFSFPIVKGDAQTALLGPNKMVITKSAARKYFGDENPIGEVVLRGVDGLATEVTAIVDDPPANSHIRFDMVVSGESWEYMKNMQWTNNNLYTYIKLHEGGDIENVRTKLNQLVKKNMGAELEQYLGVSWEQFEQQGNRVGLFLQPMTDIHLKSNLAEEITPNGNISYLYIFLAVALFIILIACINFMNLSTARSANRAKEVGIRKTIGALRSRLIFQFMSESLLYSAFSTVAAIIIVSATLPTFNLLSGKELSIGEIARPEVIVLIILFSIAIGLFAGSYPSLYLTRFKPTEVLKGKLRAGFKNSILRNSLVVIQFMISIALIFGSIAVYYQLKFMQEKNLGFNKENIVNLLHTWSLGDNARAFKNEVLGHTQFTGASFANRLPPNIDWNSAFRRGGSEQDFLLNVYQVDQDHVQTMGYTMAEGRFFSKDFPSDSAAIVLNETGFRYMGFKNLEEATVLSYQGREPQLLKVIGVVKDFNFENLRAHVKPMAILPGGEPNAEMAIRLAAGNTREQIELLEKIWKKYVPNAAFEYSFLDQNFDALFRAEQRLGRIILVFTVLAILIASLGLFGLAAYTAEQRAKEISIRKVMGASVAQLMALQTRDFTILIGIAFVIAAPLAWYLLQDWLHGFANRISLEWWMIAAAGLTGLIIALLTISYQSFSAARENPVKAMRSE